MRKTLLGLAAVLTMAAHADFVPGRFQPLSRTDLIEVREGEVLPGTSSELVLLLEDGQSSATRAVHTTNGESVEYIILESRDGCQNTIYTGNPVQKFLGSIVITDHSRSICDMYYPALQEVTINHFGVVSHHRGNPESTYSFLDAE